MNVELNDKAKEVTRRALETYLSELRLEILRTDKRDWKKALHEEREVLKDVVQKLAA